MKRKTILTICLSTLVIGILGIGQAIRWYRLKTPCVAVCEFNSDIQDRTILKEKYPKITLDANYDYHYSYKIQYAYSRGVFPFPNVKIDTISNQLTPCGR